MVNGEMHERAYAPSTIEVTFFWFHRLIAAYCLLFGVLYQGGVEVSFELQGFSREMVVTAQGLIVLFSGALAMVSAPLFAWLHAKVARHG